MDLSRAILFDWRLSLVVLGLLVAAPLGWYLGSPVFVNRVVSEALPESQGPGSPATGPHLIVRGSFGDVDAIHHGEGTPTVFSPGDGTQFLRLAELMVTNGPDLYVYLSANPAPRTSAQSHNNAGAFEVAPLKRNVGDQSYALPADLSPDNFESVVIYCRRFGVVFSSAPLVKETRTP